MSIRITKPNAGERVRVAMPAQTEGQNVTIGFSTDGANVERVGNDLVFRFEDGSETRVTNFFVTGGRALPNFVLEDGTEVSSADVLKRLNSDMDLETAAGPGGSRAASGGSGEYADDSGSLLDGVNRLGAHGRLGDWGYGGEDGLEATSEGAQNLGLINIFSTLYPLDENMFAPGNAWANGMAVPVGFVSATDPEGAPILYTLVPAVQMATVVLDDGTVFTLGTYRIDPATGELFIDLTNHTAGSPAEAAATAAANSLLAGNDYALSSVNVQMTDGANFSSHVVNPVATGVNDAPEITTPAAAIDASEHGNAWSGSEQVGTDVSIDMSQHFTDADHGEHALLIYTIGNASITHNAGAKLNGADTTTLNTFLDGISFEADGKTIKISDAALADLNSLAVGQSITITIPVTATDPHGATATKNVTLTIHGVNDAPQGTPALAQIEVSEHGNAWVSGAEQVGTDVSIDMSTHFTDIDTGDHALLVYTIGNAAITHDAGTKLNPADTALLNTYLSGLGFESDGKTIKISDAAMADLNSLAAGQTITVTIPVTATDPSGATATKNVTLIINGVNDAPGAVPGSATLEISEHGYGWAGTAENTANAAPSIDMSAHFTDPDTGDKALLEYSITTVVLGSGVNLNTHLDPVSGDHSDMGSFLADWENMGMVIDPDTGELTISAAAFRDLDSLAKGDSFTFVVTVQAKDPSGATATKDVTVTIHGVNDAPEATTKGATLEVSEHGNAWASGAEQIGVAATIDMSDDHFTDADLGDTLTYAVNNSGIVIENDTLVQQMLSPADYATLTTYLSGLSLESDGVTLKIDDPALADLNSLAQGRSITITIPVTATDSNGATATKNVTVTINGVNDDTRVDNASAVEFHMSEVGKEWVGGAEGPNNFEMSSGSLSYDTSVHFSDVDTGDAALLAYSITGIAVTGDTAEISATELAALQANLAQLFTIDPATGLVTYDPAKLTDLTRLDSGESLKITVTVSATDGKTVTPPTKDLEINVHGTESGPIIGGSLTPVLDEPGTVSWWTGSTPTNPNGVSNQYTELDLKFTDADTGDTISVTITAPDNVTTISFTTSSTGVVDTSSFSPGSTLTGDWGQLTFNTGTGKWEYWALNKADTLNVGTNGTDVFKIEATDSGSGTTVNQNMTVTVTGKDDGVAKHDIDVTHTQPAQILGPYLDPATRSTVLDGVLNLMDVDDSDTTIQFLVKDPGTGDYVAGTTSGPLEYTFQLKYGELVIKWDASAIDLQDGMGVTGNETGAWVYEYTYTAPKGSVQLNDSLTESIEIKAYDPDLYDPSTGVGQSVDINFDATIITTDFAVGYPRPVYDVLQVDVATGDMHFGLGLTPPAYGPTNNNLLDNDKTIGGSDAAWHNGSSWQTAPGVTAGAQSVTYDYGTLVVNADGTFTFTPNYAHPDIVGLGGGQTMSITVPYTITESGMSYTSYLMIQFTGENDAPVGRSFQVNVTDGYGADNGEYALGADLATDVDGDSLSYKFYAQTGVDSSGNPIYSATEAAFANTGNSSFNPADFSLSPDHNYDRPDQNVAWNDTDGDPLTTGAVYDMGYGWLIQDDDGSFRFVVNQNNADVIALKKGETLDFSIQFEASDGSASDTGTINITITGGYDKVAVKTVGDGTLSGTYFQPEVINGETTALFTYGATRESTIGSDGIGTVFNDTTGDSLAFNNAAHSGGGFAGQMYLHSNLANLVQGLDSSGSQKYAFSLNGSNLYGKDADGNIVHLGVISIANSIGLIFYPNGYEWGDQWAIKGLFTEFYIDAAGNTPLKLYVSSSDDSTSTRTEVELDFAMEFKDDSPVVTGLRVSLDPSLTAEGQVLFHDVDTKAEDLTLWVEDKNGYLVEITADGTSVDVGHGTVIMNLDGSFEYTRTDGNTDTKNIRVVVDDTNSATQGLITVEGDTASSATLGTDNYKFNFTSNNTQNASSKKIFANDTDIERDSAGDGIMLNSGTYILDNVVIKASDGNDTIECGRFGSATTEISDHFSLAAGSRFEMVLTDCTLTFESDGTLQYQIKPDMVKLYDTVTGDYYYFTFTSANAAFKEIAARTGMSEQDVKDALEFTFEYQAKDVNTGEVVTGTVEFDWGNSYVNAGQYYTEGMRLEQNISSITMNSAFDGNATDGSGNLEDVKFNNGSSLLIASDLDGDSITLRYATVDAAGAVTWQTYTADTLYDTAANGAGVSYNGTSIVPNDPSDVTMDIPVYAWVKINSDGSVSVQTATPSGTGWECIQVGTATWTASSLGSRSLIGYEADGTPIYTDITNTVNGTVSLSFLDPNDASASLELAAFHDYIRGMSEAQRQNLMFFYMQTNDGEGIESSAKLLVGVTGTDVILGDNNLPVQLTVTEDDALSVDILAGARHTVVNSTDSTSRTDIDGWRGFDFGSGEQSASANHTIDGTYGQLIWDASTKKYTYQVYADNRGDAVRAMTDGQTMSETFDYTVYDKNGESDGGQMVITIDGRSDGFTVTVPNTPLTVTEGNSATVNLGGLIDAADSGTMRYCIKYTLPNGQVIETAYDTVNPMESIATQWGRLVFSPSTGSYTFVPNGVLQEGEVELLNFEVKGVLVSTAADGSTVTQDTGWISYPIEVTGVNDAPEIGDNFFFGAAGYDTGALSWTDIDNDVAGPGFAFDGWSEGASGDTGSVSGGLETIVGDYGTLTLTQDTGSYKYTLNSNAFSGGGSRVVDEFGVNVTDPGDSGGANQQTSTDGTLTVYAVNGEYKAGTAGDDTWTITDGKSHIIHGGKGDDTINLSGSAHENVLVWRDGDQGTEGAPAKDTIIGFTKGDRTDADPHNDGDILDLRGLITDLLNQDSSHTLNDLISFEVSGGSTTINIASATDTTQTVQQIVLQGTTLDTTSGTDYDALAQQIMLITQ